MYYKNENLIDLKRVFDQNSRNGFIRMDLNENPGNLPEDFIRKTLSNISPEIISKYPDQLEFTKILAQHINADVNQICLTNGSAEAVRYVIEAYSSPGGKIVSVAPSYAMYEVYAQMYGRHHVPVRYNDDLTLDFKNIIDAIKLDVDLLIILNPNNPIGDVHSFDQMEEVIATSKDYGVSVLIDEAYHYFYPYTFIKYALENDFVFLTRTFSKVFSLAGCRLGYVVGKSAGIELIQKLCTPHNINAFGMIFAKSILEDRCMLTELISKQLEGKRFLVDELTKRGYRVSAKEGNYVFFRPNTNANTLVMRLKYEKNILVKSYDGIGVLGTCLRVTTGEKHIMQIFLDALQELDV